MRPGGRERWDAEVADERGFHQHKGRRRSAAGELHGHARPLRDRATVHTLLGTGLRREELGLED